MTQLLILLAAPAAILGWWTAFHFRKRALDAEQLNGAAKSSLAAGDTTLRALTHWMNRAHYAEQQLMVLRPDAMREHVKRRIDEQHWRERVALTSRDHTTRHSIDAINSPANDGFAAAEILAFTIGDGEVDR